jgi:predicted ATPase
LIILDNCEHLINGCAQFADTILRAASQVKLLASSREALNIGGEATYRVPSLAVPDPQRLPPLEALTQYDAVRLFAERAKAVMLSFEVNNTNAPAITQICYHLDGIPLAIELAAARVRALKVEQIAQRLGDRFRLLTGGSRTALPRHQTLRATIDWSHGLLNEQQRLLFRRLSVFAGGWTIEAAEAVCAGNGIESSEVLDLLL